MPSEIPSDSPEAENGSWEDDVKRMYSTVFHGHVCQLVEQISFKSAGGFHFTPPALVKSQNWAISNKDGTTSSAQLVVPISTKASTQNKSSVGGLDVPPKTDGSQIRHTPRLSKSATPLFWLHRSRLARLSCDKTGGSSAAQSSP